MSDWTIAIVGGCIAGLFVGVMQTNLLLAGISRDLQLIREALEKKKDQSVDDSKLEG